MDQKTESAVAYSTAGDCPYHRRSRSDLSAGTDRVGDRRIVPYNGEAKARRSTPAPHTENAPHCSRSECRIRIPVDALRCA